MRYFALACDYDGTIARHGHVEPAVVAALERLRATGRRLILVSGRELPDLRSVFDRFDLFEYLVLENGALLYRPATDSETLLTEAPSPALLAALERKGVGPVSVGRSIVATWQPHEAAVFESIRELGLELQVIFNKGAVMVLPTGVNKATGLVAALDRMGLSAHNVVGIGDAENDHAFLSKCGCAVAVSNALPMLKDRADLVTAGHSGQGVVELIGQLLESDLRELQARLMRHDVVLGTDGTRPVVLKPHCSYVVIAGAPDGGTASVIATVLEGLAGCGYQFCLIDPEGTQTRAAPAVVMGSEREAPSIDEVLRVLSKPSQSVVCNLRALTDRTGFLSSLLPRVQALRARMGRPHVIVLNDAHHLLPASHEAAPLDLPGDLHGVVLITRNIDLVSRAALARATTVITLGESAPSLCQAVATMVGDPLPSLPAAALSTGQALLWERGAVEPLRLFVVKPPIAERRHSYS